MAARLATDCTTVSVSVSPAIANPPMGAPPSRIAVMTDVRPRLEHRPLQRDLVQRGIDIRQVRRAGARNGVRVTIVERDRRQPECGAMSERTACAGGDAPSHKSSARPSA